MSDTLKAVVLVCSLNPSPAESSSDLIGRQVIDELAKHDVTATVHRIADYNIKFGVATDMGDGDEWPKVRRDIVDADILVIATPIWMGRACSIASMVMERLDAELSETDDEGRPLMYGKVGTVAVVGNEDGAHTTSAELFQAMSDVGFTIPAGGPTYWVGEAMGSIDYKDLDETPEKTATTNKTVATNSAHLARLLKNNYPV